MRGIVFLAVLICGASVDVSPEELASCVTKETDQGLELLQLRADPGDASEGQVEQGGQVEQEGQAEQGGQVKHEGKKAMCMKNGTSALTACPADLNPFAKLRDFNANNIDATIKALCAKDCREGLVTLAHKCHAWHKAHRVKNICHHKKHFVDRIKIRAQQKERHQCIQTTLAKSTACPAHVLPDAHKLRRGDWKLEEMKAICTDDCHKELVSMKKDCGLSERFRLPHKVEKWCKRHGILKGTSLIEEAEDDADEEFSFDDELDLEDLAQLEDLED